MVGKQTNKKTLFFLHRRYHLNLLIFPSFFSIVIFSLPFFFLFQGRELSTVAWSDDAHGEVSLLAELRLPSDKPTRVDFRKKMEAMEATAQFHSASDAFAAAGGGGGSPVPSAFARTAPPGMLGLIDLPHLYVFSELIFPR